MPREAFGPDHRFLPKSEILSYEEFARLVRVFASLGVHKVRLTGGEPLLRRDLETLVAAIAATPGIDDIALTTNGSLLAGRAAGLAAAGLDRVTVSLDSVDPAMFQAMSDTRLSLSTVLDGIAAAKAVGLGPVKLNTVVRRGVNDDGLLDLVAYAREHGHVLRFIEYMDVGSSNGWQLDEVVSATELVDSIGRIFPLSPLPARRRGEVARRWQYDDGGGEIGIIASVTAPFCSDCTRARITSTGELFTCLFSAHGTDLRALLRGGEDDEALQAAVSSVWARREDRYSELRQVLAPTHPAHAEMSYLGG
jgi:cyclic pyranopterin phosphate synthase